jgi:hypothetical protein
LSVSLLRRTLVGGLDFILVEDCPVHYFQAYQNMFPDNEKIKRK